MDEAEAMRVILSRMTATAMNTLPVSDGVRWTPAEIQGAFESVIAHEEASGQAISIADGVKIVGVNILENDGAITLVWKTDFDPESLHERHGGRVVILGHHDGNDLYLGYQDPLPPTIIVRYGAGGSYMSAPPSFLSDEQQQAMGLSYQEALHRARLISVL